MASRKRPRGKIEITSAGPYTVVETPFLADAPPTRKADRCDDARSDPALGRHRCELAAGHDGPHRAGAFGWSQFADAEDHLLDFVPANGDVQRALRDAGHRHVENHDLVAMALNALDATTRAVAHECLIRRGARPIARDADPHAMLQTVQGGRLVCVRCGLVDVAATMRAHLCGRTAAARTPNVLEVQVIYDNLEGSTCPTCQASYSHKHYLLRCTTCGAQSPDHAMAKHACPPTHPPQQKPKPAPAAPAGGDDEIW